MVKAFETPPTRPHLLIFQAVPPNGEQDELMGPSSLKPHTCHGAVDRKNTWSRQEHKLPGLAASLCVPSCAITFLFALSQS